MIHVGPAKFAQVVMVHGLVDPWKFVYFCDFDCPITKPLCDELIVSIEDAGASVHALTCDQGGSNQGLMKELNITPDNSSYQNPKHPNDSSKKIYPIHDWVHIDKNWRNNLLDHIAYLETGQEIHAKKEFEELSAYCRANEISDGYYLKPILTACTSSNRQVVKYSRKLCSRRTAALFRRYFPDDAAKMALAHIIEIMEDGQ